mgnify:CR=1 FL=1
MEDAFDRARSFGLFQGARFASRDAVGFAACKLADAERRKFKRHKSTATFTVLVCTSKGCPWRLRARRETPSSRRVSGTSSSGAGGGDVAAPQRAASEPQWIVSVFNPHHTCEAAAGKPRVASFNYMAKHMAAACADLVRLDTNCGWKAIHHRVKSVFGVNIQQTRAYRVRDKARELVFGDPYASFRRLRGWGKRLMANDADTRVIVDTQSEVEGGGEAPVERFTRAAVVWGPMVRALPVSKRVVALSSLSVTDDFRGRLVAAVTTDAEGTPWPIAFAYVGSATDTDCWEWFVGIVARYLNHDTTVVIGPANKLLSCVWRCRCCCFESPTSDSPLTSGVTCVFSLCPEPLWRSTVL